MTHTDVFSDRLRAVLPQFINKPIHDAFKPIANIVYQHNLGVVYKEQDSELEQLFNIVQVATTSIKHLMYCNRTYRLYRDKTYLPFELELLAVGPNALKNVAIGSLEYDEIMQEIDKYNIHKILMGTVLWVRGDQMFSHGSTNVGADKWRSRGFRDAFYDALLGEDRDYESVSLYSSMTYGFVLYDEDVHAVSLPGGVKRDLIHVSTYDHNKGTMSYTEPDVITTIGTRCLRKHAIEEQMVFPELVCGSASLLDQSTCEANFGYVLREKIPGSTKYHHVVIKTRVHEILDKTVNTYNNNDDLIASLCSMTYDDMNNIKNLIPAYNDMMRGYMKACASILKLIRSPIVTEENIAAMRLSIPKWDVDTDDAIIDKIRQHPLTRVLYNNNCYVGLEELLAKPIVFPKEDLCC